MKRKCLAIGIILLFVGTCIIPTIAQDTQKSQPTSRANWLYVGGNGPGNYTTILSAIENASNGDTVFVYSGEYDEFITIDKKLTMIGETPNSPTIYRYNYWVVSISSDDVGIRNFNIFSYFSEEGLLLYGSNCRLSNNTICTWGMSTNLIVGGDYNTLSNNSISMVTTEKSFSKNNQNNLNNNEIGPIQISGCNNILLNNSITNGDATAYDILLSGSNNIIMSNSINNKCYGDETRSIIVINSDNNSIIKNDFSGSYEFHLSITLDNSNFNKIYHNNFFRSFSAYDSGNNTWDNGYPSGGNYWSDYQGLDKNGDGIGDTPYNISGGDNQDKYPLLKPYGMTILSFNFKGGLFKYSGIIDNIGNNTAFNVQWKIVIDGGIVLLGRESSGIIPKPLLAGEETQVHPSFIFGFGKIMITIAVWADNAPYISKSTPGTLILFFVII